MSAFPLDTHKSIKLLIDAGITEKQAEAMVSLFGEVYGNETATKSDLKILHEDLKNELVAIKTDIDWIKKFMFAVGLAVLVASIKYIFQTN